jgi:hypothetical protein
VSRAGDSIEDFCRVCKIDRMHTVIAADSTGVPIRVACGYCSSEHNFRGGPRVDVSGGARHTTSSDSSEPRTASARAPRIGREPFPLVSDRERIAPAMAMTTDNPDFELLLRRVLREEGGVTPVAPADRWRGGTLVLKPGNASQEKSWPIETFFHKIVMIRNRLRTLEQQINGMEIPADAKVKLQAYISGCYGSLTSFNVLFADEDDQFKGAGGD